MAEENGNAPDVVQAQPKEKGSSDDKCIGNRKVRTLLLDVLILTFSVFAIGYLFVLVDNAKDPDDVNQGCADCVEGADSRVTGANCIVAGLIMNMFFAVVSILGVFIKTCDPNKTRAGCFPGIGFVFSASLYLFGWFWYISADKEINYRFLPTEEQTEMDAIYLSWFGEGLLYAATVILIGIDLAIPSQYLMEDEFKRLLFNLSILGVQAVLTMPAYFILAGNDIEGAAVIGSGYIIILIGTAAYLVIFLASCCATKKLQDRCLVRLLLTVAIVGGGVLTALGYYIYAGGRDSLGEPGDDAKRVAYYIGYTILIGGLCSIWGLDILWDDIKDD